MSDLKQRKAVAGRLRETRNMAGLSQAQVGVLMKLHRPTVSEIEAGRRGVPSEELSALANVYGVSTAWLLGETPAVKQSLSAVVAARELEKMKPEDLDALIEIISAIRGAKGTGD